jgi:HSP20 family protein
MTSRRYWWATALPAPDWEDLSWVPFLRPGIRVEECRAEGTYVVRAEVPGIDPARDLSVSCHKGLLRIQVHRAPTGEATRSEFRYGSAFRTLVLPVGAREDEVTARYVNGILEIRIPVTPEQALTEVSVVVPGEEGAG